MQTKIAASHCLERGQLRAYLLGRLSDEASGPILEHLAVCERCETVAEELENESDWLVNHLAVAGMDGGEDALSPSWIPRVRSALHGTDTAGEVSEAEGQDSQEPASRLGAYDLREVIGRGGMGIVYRAIHQRLGKTVALKVVAGRSSTRAGSRFEREMRAIGGLCHRAIVQATDADQIDGHAFLVMELVDGVDLRTLLTRLGPLKPADACEIASQAAAGIQAAHDAGVIHRDLKPSNLMLNREGCTKILDFGLALLREDLAATSLSTSFGRVIGTLDYLAPEQTGGTSVDARADIYGLGATLFSLLAGRPAFGRSTDTPILSHLRRVATEDAPPLSDFRADVPEELTQLVSEMLQRDLADRVETAALVASRLEPFCQGSDLTKLAEQALRAAPPASAEGDTGREGVVASLAELGLVNAPSKPCTLPSSLANESRLRPWRRAILLFTCLFLALGGGAWLGITLLLETGEGKLRIESQAEQVQVTLAREGATATTVEIEQDTKRIRLRAGKYEVRIKDAADGVRLSQNQIRVLRGEEVVLTVTRDGRNAGDVFERAKPEDMGLQEEDALLSFDAFGAPIDQTDPLHRRLDESELVWDGKPARAWLDVLENEREPGRRHKAVAALTALAPDMPPQVAAEVLIRAGAATVAGFVESEAHVAAIIAAEPALWEDDTTSNKLISSHLFRLLRPAVSNGCHFVVEALAKLPVEVIMERARAVDDDLARKAIVLRALLRIGLTRADTAQLHGELTSHVLFADTLTSLVLSTHGGQTHLMTNKVEKIRGNDFGTNSAEAVICLRLTKVLPNDLSPLSRMHLLARGIAYNRFDLAEPMYRSARLRPVRTDTRAGLAFVSEIAPVLHAQLNRPGFVERLSTNEFGPLDALIDFCYQNPPQGDKLLPLLEIVLQRLAEWRDSTEVLQNEGDQKAWRVHYRLSAIYSRAAELFVCLKGSLPDSVVAEIGPMGGMQGRFRQWAEAEGELATRDNNYLLPVLAQWFPYHTTRVALQESRHITTSFVVPELLWLASAASVAGDDPSTDQRIADGLLEPIREGKRSRTIRRTLSLNDRARTLSEIRQRHVFASTFGDEIITRTQSQLLRVTIEMLRNTSLRYWPEEEVLALIHSDDPVVMIQAVLWTYERWTQPKIREAVVQALTRPGFDDLSAGPTLIFFQRLVLLDKLMRETAEYFPSEHGPLARQLAAELVEWAERRGVPDSVISATVPVAHALVPPADQIVSEHPLTPAVRIIGRDGPAAAALLGGLRETKRVLEAWGDFRGPTGGELARELTAAIELGEAGRGNDAVPTLR